MNVPKDTSKGQLKKKFGGTMPSKEDDDDWHTAGYLLGQFAKNNEAEGKISGKELLEIVFDQIEVAQSIAGGRFILLDVDKTHSKVIEFYEKHGFVRVNMTSEEDEYLQMVKYI